MLPAQAQRDLLHAQNDLTLSHSQKEADLTSRIQELESRLHKEQSDSALNHAVLRDQLAAAQSQLEELLTSNALLREQLSSMQVQVLTTQRELDSQSKTSAALLTDSARVSKLEADFSASLLHSRKLQEQLISCEKGVTSATAAKNEAEFKALKATQAHDSLLIEFNSLKSECNAKDTQIDVLQDSCSALKETVLVLTQKNEYLLDSLRGTDMMNSDAVSIIDDLHAKERSLNEENVRMHRYPSLQRAQHVTCFAGYSSIASAAAPAPNSTASRQ